MALLKNVAQSDMVLEINGEDRILKPGEAVEADLSVLEQNRELREVKKIHNKAADDKDAEKLWIKQNGRLPEGQVLVHQGGDVVAVDEYIYEEVPREEKRHGPTRVVKAEELPFADGRVVVTKEEQRKLKEEEESRHKEANQRR